MSPAGGITTRESAAIAKAIVKINPRFSTVIDRSGICTIRVMEPLENLSGGTLQAKKLADISNSELRAAGCSNSKARAIRELATATTSKAVPMNSLHRLDDDEIMKHLLPLFGIGKWTVEMFLMFQLGRQDIWPVGDLGVRRGWEKIHGMRTEITPKKLDSLGHKYAPYRSHVAWYCWRAIEVL